jgi:hypothetical protein
LEEGGKTSGSLVSHTQSTATLLSTAGTSNVVLEDTRGAIVGEALTEFDNGDQESALGERLSDLAEGSKILGGRLDTTDAIFLDNDRSRVGAINVRLLERGMRAGDVGVVDGSTVDMGLVISNLLVVLECLGAMVRLVESNPVTLVKLTQ